MYTLALFLTSLIALAQTATLPEHSSVKRFCLPSTAEDPNPPCRQKPDPPLPSDPSIHSYTINDPGIFGKAISIKITVPDTLSVETWNDVLLANLQTTLPITLQQFNVDASQIPVLASEGIPLLVEAITAVQSGLSLPDTDTDIVRRGFLSKIGKWIKKVLSFLSLQNLYRQC